MVSGLISGSFFLGSGDQGVTALQLAGAGLFSWFLGLRWYGIDGMGLRARRPLYAGIGFSVLGWIVFLVARFFLVLVVSYGTEGAARIFVYLLLFEAFCTQLWTMGIFFRSVADWRGPLTASVASGFLFGAIAFIFFQESYVASGASLIFFPAWGIFYGIIRLRTGSLVGMVVIQAIQSWSAWVLLVPPEQPEIAQLRNMYLISTLLFAVLIWRLWPRREDDYRV